MRNQLLRLFASPIFADDEEKTRSAGFINALVLSNIPILVLFIIVRTTTGAGELFGPANLILIAIITILTIAWALMRTGWVRLAGYLHVTTIWLATTMIAFIGGGIGGSTFASYFVVMLVAGLFLGWRPAIGYTFISILVAFALADAETFSTAIEGTVLFVFGAILLYLIINSLQNAVKRAKTNASELQASNQQLMDLRDALEIRVKERTAALEKRAAQLQTIAEFSQTIAQVQNPNEIFPTAARLISERFGFYHVGIFLVDSHNESAILQAANSEGGKKMLERGHRLALGTGVVGFTAETGKPRIALDVGADAVFFNNPELPETRSEVALPLISGEKTIGVLDVQSTESGAFTEDDLKVLGTLANQVAIALENARLLSEARASAIQVQEVYNEFVRTEWSRTAKGAEQPGFRYSTGRIEMLDEPLQDAVVASAVQTGKVVANQTNGSEEKRTSVAVPVKLRGEVIGVLQVESIDSSRMWLENELSLMEAVAERAALAMENARLFQDARRRAAKEQLISEATARVSGSLSVENILQTTASELERVLGGSEVLIQFKSKETK